MERIHLGGGRTLPRLLEAPPGGQGHPASAGRGTGSVSWRRRHCRSNHGGRQIEALPAAIDALPAVAAQVGNKDTVLMDLGVRSGVNVGRALALGAAASFAGKAFLWGLGALGEAGPGHVITLLVEELRATLGQVGATMATVREVEVRHPGPIKLGPVRSRD